MHAGNLARGVDGIGRSRTCASSTRRSALASSAPRLRPSSRAPANAAAASPVRAYLGHAHATVRGMGGMPHSGHAGPFDIYGCRSLRNLSRSCKCCS